MSSKFCWTTLHVGDMDRALAFYRDAFDIPVKSQTVNDFGSRIVVLGGPESGTLELVEVDGFVLDKTDQESVSLGFEVEDATAIMQQLGISDYLGPFEPGEGVRFFFIFDPEGYRVQLIEK